MPRPIWTGTISFGLVSVPVKLFAAVSQKDVAFHQLEEGTGARIRYKRVSERTGREVPYDKIVKGYEIDKDTYVTVTKKELEKLDPESTREIDIQDFVDQREIDPMLYEHTYYLAPGAGGSKAYALLHKALQETGRVGLGKVVIRNKQYLSAVRTKDGVLVMDTMLFPDEVVPVSSIPGVPVKARVDTRELKVARQLVDALTAEFDPKRYRDEYRDRLLDYLEAKAEGETISLPTREERPKVRDLMEALRASVEAAEDRPAKARSSRRKPAKSSRKRSHAA